MASATATTLINQPVDKVFSYVTQVENHTAWQEGGDNDPVNQMAAVHLDLASWSFGIQEENHFRPEELDLFPGHALLEGGHLYANDRPGLGIDLDEEKAAALLHPDRVSRPRHMAEDRRADGTVVRP